MKLLDWLIDTVASAHPAVQGLGVAAASTVAPYVIGGNTLPFFGVSITTLGMSAAGSMIAFAYGTPVNSRKKLYGYAIGGTFIGIWSVILLPGWLGWEWYKPEVMEPPIAGVVALLSRWIVPLVVENIPALWRRVTNQPPAPSGE